MKSQDKLLMKKFTRIRETLNDIHENGLVVDRGRNLVEVLDLYLLSPDPGPGPYKNIASGHLLIWLMFKIPPVNYL